MPRGMPGGMPGMPGGMPGMPDIQAMADQLGAALKQRLAAMGITPPAGVSLTQFAGGAALILVGGVYMASRFLSMYVLALVGLVAYWGTMIPSGRNILAKVSSKLSSILRRPLPPYVVLCALCLAVAIIGHTVLPGKSVATSSMGGSRGSATAGQDYEISQAIREAYEQGYEDGVAGEKKRPPKHIPSSRTFDTSQGHRGSSSGFGTGSIMKYGMVGYYAYNLGKTPGGWNPQVAMVNAKANPTQLIMMAVMLSGILF